MRTVIVPRCWKTATSSSCWRSVRLMLEDMMLDWLMIGVGKMEVVCCVVVWEEVAVVVWMEKKKLCERPRKGLLFTARFRGTR